MGISASCALVLSERLATLAELQTLYSLEDMLTLADMAMVNNYNKWLSYKTAQEKH